MKNFITNSKSLFVALAAVAISFSACQKEEVIPNNNPAGFTASRASSSNYSAANGVSFTACGSTTVDFLAGQSMDAGDITISNDENYCYVTYTLQNGWEMTQLHLYVGSLALCPVTGSGNPQPGQFPYAKSFKNGETSWTVKIPLSSLPENFIVAAHANVDGSNATNGSGGQTAWGDGEDFSGANWFTYTKYTKASCNG